MLSPNTDAIRLFVHVLAASVWVGGQIVLGALVPSLRKSHPDSLNVVARAFGRIAWPAFGVVIVTGIWNILDISMTNQSSEYQATVFVHVLLAALTGAAAAVHSLGRTRLALAVGGALGLVSALAALFVGVLIGSGA